MVRRLIAKLMTVATVFCAGLVGNASAQLSCPPDPAAPSPEQLASWFRNAPERGFLWEIEKDGRTSWLFGTIHTAKPQWIGLGPKTITALRQANVIALEINPLDPVTLAAMQSDMAAMVKDDRANPLPAALQERLATVAQNNCVVTQAIESLPAVFTAVSAILNGARKDGLEPAFGIDVFVAGFAQGAKKPVVQLESVAAQMKLVSGLFGDDRKAGLSEILDAIESGASRAQMQKLAKVWETADHELLRTYLQWCECVKTEKEAQTMAQTNDARNPGMADGIDAVHSKGQSVFAAVGALHFTGPKALQALMAAKGYAVRVVK